MPNDRTPYLQELIRYSSKATLLILSSLINEKRNGNNHCKMMIDALNYLKKDPKLIINEKPVENGFTEITIELVDKE